MPSPDEFIGVLLEFPLVQVLRTCARRLKLRFALRGGVLRNHLFTLASKDSPPNQLYDYVDPFSDIDVVLEDVESWPRLAQAISESIPFSGFHHWEATTVDALHKTSTQFASIAPDRLLLWFDGTSSGKPDIRVDALGVDAKQTITQASLSISSLAEKSVRASAFTDVLDLLRLARYSFAFPRIAADFDVKALFRRINAVPQAPAFWHETETESADRRRLDIALLDLIFTAYDWNMAVEFIYALVERLPTRWFERTPTIRKLLDRRFLSSGTGLGVVLYKQTPQSHLNIELFTQATQPPSQELSNIKNLVPWIRMNSYGHNPNDCCSYRDFANGVATVAWRTKDSNRTVADFSASEIGAIAAVDPVTNEESLAFPGGPPLLSLPSFVQKGQSLTTKVDHGYVRSFLNHNASFRLGIVHIPDLFKE